MGRMVDGVWTTQWYKSDSKGHFKRPQTRFRSWIRDDGSTEFAPQAGRYHLYVSLACPWANRTLVVRALRGLTDAIDVSVVHPLMLQDGWTFDDDWDGATGDRLLGHDKLWQVYAAANATYSGRVTVPVLWDRQTGTIVNNESKELIEMFDVAFHEFATGEPLFGTPDRAERVHAMIEANYGLVNDGVYRCGFASSQQAYEEAAYALFRRLDELEELLSQQRFLIDDKLSAADVCLFTTLFRFDLVYHTHFSCNLRRLIDYPNLWSYTRDVYQTPGVAETMNIDHIKNHYFRSHESIRPRRIVPIGPQIDFDEPHDRDRFG